MQRALYVVKCITILKLIKKLEIIFLNRTELYYPMAYEVHAVLYNTMTRWGLQDIMS